MCNGSQHSTERGVGRRYGEAKCGERGDRGVGHGAPHANCDHHERVKGPSVRVTCSGDKASNRGARIAQEPRIILGVLTLDSRVKVGVVSDGELDRDNNTPVMVEAVQVRAERAVSVVAVIAVGGCTSTIISVEVTRSLSRSGGASASEVAPARLSWSRSLSRPGGASVAREQSGTHVARDNRQAAADTTDNSGSARHCGLSRSVLLGAHWRAVCF